MLSSTVLCLALLAVATALPTSNSGLSQVRTKRQLIYCNIYPNDPNCTKRRKMHVDCETNPNSPHCPRIGTRKFFRSNLVDSEILEEKQIRGEPSTKAALGFLQLLDDETRKNFLDVIKSILEVIAKSEQKLSPSTPIQKAVQKWSY